MNNYSKKSCEIELKNKYGDGLVEAPYEFKQNEESFEKLYNVDDQITLGEALFEITKRFIPSSLALVIEYCILVINLTFISVSSDTVTTSGCGLGNATINILVFSVGSGFCGGIDTLVSQAFGRKDYYLCGVYLNTSRIVTILLNMVQLILLLNSESLFLLLGQNEETAFIASQYMVWILPGLFLNMQFECLRRFLLVQGIYRPIMFILSITFVIHIIGLYLFLIQLDLKLYGVAISSTITYTLNFLLLTLYVHYKKDLIPSESWHLFNKSCLTKIPNYLEFALPACLLNMVEWWAFELMVIFCGMISQTSLVTLSIILTINTMIFMFTQGISYTCVTRRYYPLSPL